ncbi:MAG TPA: hypothetical protein VN695_04705, partial [Streptosporangiaceae bacterium]|nr:hypothetical protein [Streptosporangiaceae bacterium]
MKNLRALLVPTVAIVTAGVLGAAVLGSAPAGARAAVAGPLLSHRPVARPISPAKQAAVLANLRNKI